MKTLLSFTAAMLMAVLCAAQIVEIKAKKGWSEQLANASQSVGIVDSVVIYTTEPTRTIHCIVKKITLFHHAPLRTVIVVKKRDERFLLFYHAPAL
jgi:hypothetical protein